MAHVCEGRTAPLPVLPAHFLPAGYHPGAPGHRPTSPVPPSPSCPFLFGAILALLAAQRRHSFRPWPVCPPGTALGTPQAISHLTVCLFHSNSWRLSLRCWPWRPLFLCTSLWKMRPCSPSMSRPRLPLPPRAPPLLLRVCGAAGAQRVHGEPSLWRSRSHCATSETLSTSPILNSASYQALPQTCCVTVSGLGARTLHFIAPPYATADFQADKSFEHY